MNDGLMVVQLPIVHAESSYFEIESDYQRRVAVSACEPE